MSSVFFTGRWKRRSGSREGPVGRSIKRILLAQFLLCALPFLTGCLPGYNWGGSEDDGSSLSGTTQTSPALNRTYKSSFLSLQMPSLGSPRLQGQLMPDAGPVLNSFYTVEARRPAQANTPVGFGSEREVPREFEPSILPAEQALGNFYSALAALASGRHPQPVAILHFGDDRIVDDHFAGALRELLINRFGSAGRGMMMPGLFPIRGMKVDRAGQWTLASASAESAGPFGITGARMSSSASDAWLRFTATQGTFDWVEINLLTGPGRGTAVVTFDGDSKLIPTATLRSSEASTRIAVKSHEILIRPRGDGEISILSVATGVNTPGLIYANLGLPGAAAWTPIKWDPGFAANELRKLSPDLIILGYGTREAFNDDLDIGQYESRLRLVIDQVKVWAPKASILIVGPPDAARLPAFSGSAGAQVCRSLNPQEVALYSRLIERSDERLARWHNPPRLDAVRAALKRAASASGAFYWDWAKYMGGSCSIHAWTSSKPPLAAPDHLTLTDAGNDRSARALFAEIMAGYESYQRAIQAKAKAIASAEAAAHRSSKPTRKKNP